MGEGVGANFQKSSVDFHIHHAMYVLRVLFLVTIVKFKDVAGSSQVCPSVKGK